jgi:16S rRNA processing protein RimM
VSEGAEFITVGRVVKTQGRRGEVGVDLLTDFPERFESGRRVFVLATNGDRRELQINDVWPHKGLLILKFGGVDSMTDAEALLKNEIQVPLSERTKLEAGTWYVSDLIGCAVFEGAREIGKVANVEFGAGEAPLLIVREESAGKAEHMIPLTEAFTKRVDTEQKTIELQLPEGILEINAPLTAEEKKQE